MLPTPGRSRILFLVRSLEAGGAERQLVVLANALQARGIDTTVAVYHGGGAYEATVSAGVRLVDLDKRGFHGTPTFFTRAVKLVRRLRPTVIHGYMDAGNVVASALRPFCPGSLVAWGVRASNLDLSLYGRPTRLLDQIARFTARSADVIICNSRAGADYAISRGYPQSRVSVVHNGIETDRFTRAADRAVALRSDWGVAPNECVIGYVARLDPTKDHATFAAAARILYQRRPNVRFICVGDGVEPHRSQAIAALERSGIGDKILIRGFRTDMPSVYSAFDVSTSCSLSEGFSNVIAEAMSCGTPCVATDVGDSRQIIGMTGDLVPCQDPEALANGWERLLAKVGSSLSDECRSRIVEHFSVERLTQNTVGVLGL